MLLHLWPQRLWNIYSGTGRALLALELKCGSDGASDDCVDVGGWVDKVVIFAATLSNQLREPSVVVKVLTYSLPQPLERTENENNCFDP